MNNCKLGDIADSQTGPFGSQLHEEDYVKEGIPIVTVEHLGDIGFTTQNLPFVSEQDAERLSKYTLNEGDIVFSRVGAIDRCVFTKKEQVGWLFSGRCIRVRCDSSKVNPRYLSYYFKLPSFKKMMLNLSVGATMPSLNTHLMDNVKLNLLDRESQDKIATFLDNIDSKIENNNQIISQLESLAKTIYDYWFLQFEFPNEDGNPYKSSGGKMVWNEELKRDIPEGWEYKPIVSLLSQDKGGDWGKELLTGNYQEHVNCIRGADFPAALGYKVMNAPERWILTKNKHKELSYGDILVEISGGSPTQSTGRVCYINNNFLKRFDNSVIASNFCKALSLKCPKYYSWFYLMWQKLYDNGLFFNYEGKTTGLKNLLFEVATTEVKILIPNDAVLNSFTALVDSMFEKIQFNCKESQELASLRDFLLPMLMNGQVTFKD